MSSAPWPFKKSACEMKGGINSVIGRPGLVSLIWQASALWAEDLCSGEGLLRMEFWSHLFLEEAGKLWQVQEDLFSLHKSSQSQFCWHTDSPFSGALRASCHLASVSTPLEDRARHSFWTVTPLLRVQPETIRTVPCVWILHFLIWLHLVKLHSAVRCLCLC